MSVAAITLRRLRSRSFLFTALGLILAPVEEGFSATFCANVESLAGEAGSNFSDWTTGATGVGARPKLSGAEDCAVTQSLSGLKTYHCTWEFSYRAKDAYLRFDAVKKLLKECFGDAASVSSDQRVNHPDFYDLQLYRLNQAEVAVSIKDKSALQRTYLFLRVRGAKLK